MMKSYKFQIKVEPDTFNDGTPLKHTVVGAKDTDWGELCVKYRAMIDNESTPKAGSSSASLDPSGLQENSIPDSPERNSQFVSKKRSHPSSDQKLPSGPTGSSLSRDPRLRQKQ